MEDGRWTVNPVQGNAAGSNPATPTKIFPNRFKSGLS